MDWRSRLNDPKTIESLDKIIDGFRAWRKREDWNQREYESTVSEEQRAEDEEFLALEEFGKSDEELRPECFYMADVLLQYLHQPSRPWGVFHRSDLIDAVSPLLEKESLPSAKELVDAVGSHLQNALSSHWIRIEARQARQGMFRDLFVLARRSVGEENDHPKMTRDGPILREDYSKPVELGSVQVGVTGASICREDEGRSLICLLEARVTPAARIAFSAAVRDVVAAALSVATETLHTHPPLQQNSHGGIIHDSEREDSVFPQVLHDGASSAGTTENSEAWMRFDLGKLPFSSKSILRFVDLVQIVFSAEVSPNSERGGTRELRHALSTMADRSALSISPLGMVGSIFVFESCLAHSFKYKKNKHGEFVSFLSKRLGLGGQEKARLDRVFQARNAFVHKVTYDERVDLVLVAARLAWAAAHYLTCTVRGIFDTNMTHPEELRETLREILRTS